MRVVTPETFSEPLAYGYVMQPGGSVALFFTEPDRSFLFIFGSGLIPTGVLTNASRLDHMGRGYSFRAGTQNIIYSTPLRFAENMAWINSERHGRLAPLGVPVPQQYLEAKMLIDMAFEAFAAENYSREELLALEAWNLLVEDYTDLRENIESTTSTAPLIAFLLIPFVFLIERLVFASKELKKVVTILAIFSSTFLAFLLMHPGFTLISSALMVIVGTCILIFPIVTIILNIFMETVSA